MRYSAAEKHEIIQLVQNSNLPVRKTLDRLDICKSTFYGWLKRFEADGMTEDFAKKGKSHRILYERTIYRRKQLAVQRHLRIAHQYIENVGKGAFPLRSSR